MQTVFIACSTFVLLCAGIASPPGSWPEPRQNAHLTGEQPMSGAMTNTPEVVARFDLGRSRPPVIPVTRLRDGADVGLSVVAGAILAFSPDGSTLWRSHPAGLNFERIEAVDDFDGDGGEEILAAAGRPTPPYGAAVLISLEDGAVIWRYDVEPMSYAWYLYRGHYVPDRTSQQIVVLMHAYPPDVKNGYIALFDFAENGAAPTERWRYDFSEYTCFPSLLQTDLEGDGVKELVVETHSRMWVLDALSGGVKKFVKWDVSPANVRSYGLVRFVDLNKDGLEDFLCIGTFAQHHEVLINTGGDYAKAWHQGWAESVTTGKVDTAYPEPPYADVDGDGALEIVVSMFNGDGEGAWCTRVYDALSGAIKRRIPGLVAVSLHDVDGNGRAEVLANGTSDPTLTTLDGAKLMRVGDGDAVALWEDVGATAIDKPGDAPFVRRGGQVCSLVWRDGSIAVEPWEKPAKPAKERFASVPEMVGPPMPTLLAADLLPGAGNELVVYSDPVVRVIQWREGSLVQTGEYTSSSVPVLADMDGDARCDMVLSTVHATTLPQVRVISPANDGVVWERGFPNVARTGLPQPRTAYVRAAHFTGKSTPDLYVWAGTPVVRSAGVDGATGALLWEKGEFPELERYWGASVNYASAYDFDRDGDEDLVFTNPDYYCVADGRTGELLVGPAFPPDIFSQPCQGLYTYPAILPRADGEPLVGLVSGHYFQAAMTLSARPLWYQIPAPGDNRAGSEAFMLVGDGAWVMGFGRQNGMFACVDALSGQVHWEFPVNATCSDAIAGDVDGDGHSEFVVGTSHGELIAIGEEDGNPRVVWRANLGAGLGAPILADVDGDGACEAIVGTTTGDVVVCR